MRNRSLCTILAALVTTVTLAIPAAGDTDATDPADMPALFAPGLISDGINNRDLTLSPDGRELYTSVTLPRAAFGVILVSRLRDGTWSTPEVAGFSGRYGDIEPMFAPDGTLFFASQRPLREGSSDWNLWRVTRTQEGWSEPTALPPGINTEGDEFYPSVAANGTLYFTSARAGGAGREDIWRARPMDGGYAEPENLGEGVNSPTWEFNAFVDPEERYLLFSSQGRDDDSGGGDLYVSLRGADGAFEPAVNLGPAINSPGLDYCPFVTADGQWLYFTSNRYRTPEPDAAPLTYAEVRSRFQGLDNGLGNIYRVRVNALPFGD